MCDGECSAILGFEEAQGTCWVATDRLYFYSRDINAGFSVDYESISMHAISRVGTGAETQQSSVYLQLDFDAADNSNGERVNVNDIVGEDVHPIYELKLYPSSEEAVEKLFLSLSECSCLHPDSDDIHSHSDEAVSNDEGAR